MQHLGAAVSQHLERRYETPKTTALTAEELPAEIAGIDRLARIITWRGTDGNIEIARALTEGERQELQKRADDLAPALEPFNRERLGDFDRAAMSAADMYGSFPSMRQEGVDAVSRIESLVASLIRHNLPTWAIEQACRSIQDDGYERDDGKKKWTERQWAPSDSEIAKVAMRIVRRRSIAKANALAILGATVGR